MNVPAMEKPEPGRFTHVDASSLRPKVGKLQNSFGLCKLGADAIYLLPWQSCWTGCRKPLGSMSPSKSALPTLLRGSLDLCLLARMVCML